MKVSQGINFIDGQAKTNANKAKAAGLKIGYYHYAEQYTDSNIDSDIIANAQAQAKHFIEVVKTLPKPDFQLTLDLENFEDKNGNVRNWSVVKKINDLWVDTFIKELKNAKYDIIIYSGKPWLDDHITTSKFNSIPLWHSQWLLQPEITNPTISNAWKDWIIWQFSSNGKINGYTGNIDINVMRKSFFNQT
jgi:lysozyme